MQLAVTAAYGLLAADLLDVGLEARSVEINLGAVGTDVHGLLLIDGVPVLNHLVLLQIVRGGELELAVGTVQLHLALTTCLQVGAHLVHVLVALAAARASRVVARIDVGVTVLYVYGHGRRIVAGEWAVGTAMTRQLAAYVARVFVRGDALGVDLGARGTLVMVEAGAAWTRAHAAANRRGRAILARDAVQVHVTVVH